MMTRERAMELVAANLPNANLVKHCLASEAIMRTLAPRFGGDADAWGLAGLLHDLDYEETKAEMTRHGEVTAAKLAAEDLPAQVVEAIKEHNAENLGLPGRSTFGTALTAAETVTGLIVAAALVLPEKRIAAVRPETVVNRMKEKGFARSVNRDHIRMCETIGIPLEEFLGISLCAMTAIAGELGL
jgi:putative nucleotidyltransferase with HDIG domain